MILFSIKLTVFYPEHRRGLATAVSKYNVTLVPLIGGVLTVYRVAMRMVRTCPDSVIQRNK